MTDFVSPLDGAFLFLDTGGAAMRIGAVIELRCEGNETSSDQYFHLMRETLQNRIHESPLLTRTTVRARADLRWPRLEVDRDFDVDHHIVRHTMPLEGSAEQLNALIGDYLSRPVASGRPLWQLLVIDGGQSGVTYVVVKIHHSLADGVAGVGAIANFFDLSPEIRAPKATVSSQPPTNDRTTRWGGRDAMAAWRARGRFLQRTVMRLLGSAERRTRDSRQPSVWTARRASWDGESSVDKSWARTYVPLADMKRVARSNGGTITDAVIAIVGGALGEFARGRGERFRRDLVAFVPINVRSSEEDSGGGNQISGMLVRLRVAAQSRRDRVRLIARDTAHTVAEQRASRAGLFVAVPRVLGPVVVGWGARFLSARRLYDRLPTVANLMISSVPGPSIPLWFAGQKIVSVVPIGPLFAGFSLNVTVLSFADRLEFGLFAGREQFPDLARLRDLIESEALAMVVASGDEGGATR